MRNSLFILISLFLVASCREEPTPKPKGLLRLEYESASYESLDIDCPYRFEKNSRAQVDGQRDCSLVLQYPAMNASIFITYKEVDNNLNALLNDAQKLTYEHVVKADNITEQPFINEDDRVYGMFYELRGDAASQSQFYVTDSTRHFLTGSLYFNSKPNYDSVFPAAIYLENDIRKIMESLRWQEK
ncbi:gliding motility lipoprotein GldD [Robertkochia aurantiaca]|uniref:gliding motility lipoprotein GldD n=1 Tax=Robertkochia aurantiaca TaxID=2873700 RepID=UPI001CCFFADA|nr:gliding motility lipoprotein GldD [Robertkochia sp. 3YJGBD-33]